MKVYNYLGIGNDENDQTCVAFGIGSFSSEKIARSYAANEFFALIGFRPQQVQLTVVLRSRLEGLLSSNPD